MSRDNAHTPVEVMVGRATVPLDARALDELGPATLDRLAGPVGRQAAGQAPLLGATQTDSTDIQTHNPRGAL